MLSGPFRSTSDYLSDFVNRFSRSDGVSDEGQTQLSNVRNILSNYLTWHGDEPYIRRLQRPDFDAHNFIFTDPSLNDGTSPLRLIGVTDWGYAHTSPLYLHHPFISSMNTLFSYRAWARSQNSTRSMPHSDHTLFMLSDNNFHAIQFAMPKPGLAYLRGSARLLTASIIYLWVGCHGITK